MTFTETTPIAEDTNVTASAELDAFRNELKQVESLLFSVLDGLYPPLSSIARTAVRTAIPLRRAALILAVAVPGYDSTPSTQQALSPELLRERRILLAAALEMLSIALGIHSNLLSESHTSNDHSLDKSVMGSTILTGDYCFSRAAWLAAQTESPVVVDLFSQALKVASEGLLRLQMHPTATDRAAETPLADANTPSNPPPFNADYELAIASVHASAHLANLGVTSIEVALALAPRFVHVPPAGDHLPFAQLNDCSAAQRLRWQAALAWLGEIANGTK